MCDSAWGRLDPPGGEGGHPVIAGVCMYQEASAVHTRMLPVHRMPGHTRWPAVLLPAGQMTRRTWEACL